jgi:hypothetical protein
MVSWLFSTAEKISEIVLVIPSRLGYYLHMSDSLTATVRQILRNTSISQDAEFRFMQAVKYVRVVHGTKLQSAIDFVKEVRAA